MFRKVLPGILFGLMTAGTLGAAPLSLSRLRTEYRINPLGIDETRPRLAWIVESDRRGAKQTAARILVASTVEKLESDTGDLWDTGKVPSSQTTQIVYDGKALGSGDRCYWKVKVWDENGTESAWSAQAYWSMGLLKKDGWKGKWIGWDAIPAEGKVYLPSPHLRKEFEVSGEVAYAALYVTAQGFAEMRLNGQRVGGEYFTPGWTDYRKRIYYRTYDVTSMLNLGANALGAILGDGWFRGNISWTGQNKYGRNIRVLTQLHIRYADGQRKTIASDSSWKASFGPILQSDMQAGETYDARREIPGWDTAGFDDGAWQPVDSGSAIQPLIQAYPGVPVRPTRELQTAKLTRPEDGVYVFDLGQNFSGWIRLKVRGEAGSKVVMRFGEMLNKDGTVYTANLRSARATDTYICKGGGEETWEPLFTFHGFRYVQITGLPGKPRPEDVTGIVVHSDAPLTSSFECSNPMLNKLYSNILWGQLSNYLEVPTDCPQRDERLGWTGDTQVFMRTGTYNQDVSTFFSKWIVDLMDTQQAGGAFGNQAPVFHGHGSPAWEDAGIICPWTMHKVYGDTRLLETYYTNLERFVRHADSRKGGGYGDWLAVGSSTPKSVIALAYNAQAARMMVDIAEALGRTDDVGTYREMFEKRRVQFQTAFVKPDGTVAGNSQTAYCLALHFDLLTEAQRKQVADHLVERIKAKDFHLSVGFVGVPILLPALTEIGRSDLAYRLIQNKTYPSWGYSIEQGATTIWERWNSYTRDKGFGNPGMNSFNHYAYGSCGEWMFATMLGIVTDGPGFKRLLIAPEPGGGITYAKGHYDSIHGRIRTAWKLKDSTLTFNLTVPANTTATVKLPARNAAAVTEGGKTLSAAVGTKFLRMEANKAVVAVDSGTYRFETEMPKE